MRNHIAHGYFNIDAYQVFDVVKNDIPDLNKILTSLKEELESDLY